MVSFNVTRRAISLGSRDSWSGWRAITWTETTKEMIIIPQGATQMMLAAGVYPRLDAVGITGDAFAVGDQVKDSVNEYWDIKSIRPFYWGDSFIYRECDLVQSVMYQASFSSTTWSKTRGSDPRYRGKVFLDTYLTASQITKDDDSTAADYGVIFNDPPYPIDLEFRGGSNMEGLFVVDQPVSTALTGAIEQEPYGYDEVLPVHIMTVDSTDCSGSALCWKMEAELRETCEGNAIGTSRVRNVEQTAKNDRNLGNLWLYDRVFMLRYKRGISV